MTNPILPEFILQLFQDEIDKIVESKLKQVCELYELDFDEVAEKVGHVRIDMTKTPGFKIIKKYEHIPTEDRCIARMFTESEIIQCSKKHKDGELCARHSKMRLENTLKYGTINDPLTDELQHERIIPKEERCIARILHDLEIKQCNHKHKDGELCKRHAKIRLNSKLKYGTIHDPIIENDTVPKEQRCLARMLHDLEIKQCSHRHKDGELCGRHAKMKLNHRLIYGLINDPIPDELRHEVLDEKRKNNIY